MAARTAVKKLRVQSEIGKATLIKDCFVWARGDARTSPRPTRAKLRNRIAWEELDNSSAARYQIDNEHDDREHK